MSNTGKSKILENETMDAKGICLIKKEFTATTFWPNPVPSLTEGFINLEEEYKKALAGQICHVMDMAVDGNSYLVFGHGEKCGGFIWSIEKEDTVTFLPIIKKYGIIMPAGLSPMEEFAYLASNMENITEKYTK
jgi:hypothetical protein